MVRVAVKLIIIFLLVSVGVYLWYGHLEKELLSGIEPPKKTRAENKTATVTGTVQSRKMTGAGAENFQIIVQRNIFQADLDSTKAVVEEVAEEVAPTTLNLTLLGTVTGNDRDARAIIIDNKDRQQDIYQIGDAIQGAFVDSIERGKITLDVNGKKEALLIKDREGGGPGAPPVPASAAQRSPKKNVEKKETRKAPRVRPNRRISFRQNSEQSAANSEELEKLPGLGESADDDDELSGE